jgi:hypothetical protein
MNVEKVSLYVLYNANEVREQSPFFSVQKSMNPKTMPNSLEDTFPVCVRYFYHRRSIDLFCTRINTKNGCNFGLLKKLFKGQDNILKHMKLEFDLIDDMLTHKYYGFTCGDRSK